MASDENTVYLGDGAYASICDPTFIKIYTSNGIETTNSVYLDLDAMRVLKKLIEKMEDDGK